MKTIDYSKEWGIAERFYERVNEMGEKVRELLKKEMTLPEGSREIKSFLRSYGELYREFMFLHPMLPKETAGEFEKLFEGFNKIIREEPLYNESTMRKLGFSFLYGDNDG